MIIFMNQPGLEQGVMAKKKPSITRLGFSCWTKVQRNGWYFVVFDLSVRLLKPADIISEGF